jgi:hypothetical protein
MSPKERATSSGNNELSQGKAQVLQKNICFESFCNHNHLSFFYIILRPIIGIALRRVTTL